MSQVLKYTLSSTRVATKPFKEQKPGTSGLRKPVDVFRQAHYVENFVQSLFNALPKEDLAGSTLIVGGDGRFFMDEAVRIIIKIAAANKVGLRARARAARSRACKKNLGGGKTLFLGCTR